MPNIRPRAQLPLLLSPLCSTTGGIGLDCPYGFVMSYALVELWLAFFTQILKFAYFLEDIWLVIQLNPVAPNFQDVEKYKLGNPKSFHYLNQSNCYELVGVSDAHEYLATRRAMDIVGISTQEQVKTQLCPSVH